MDKENKKIELLLKFLQGELSAPEKKKIRADLKTDEELARILALMKEMVSEGQSVNWNQLRNLVQKLSRRMFTDYRKSLRKKSVPFGVRIFDSRAMPLPEGVRPAAVDSRRLKYAVGNMMLEIFLYPVSIDSCEFVGRLADVETAEPLTVTLKSEKFNFTTETDEHLVFRFPRVPMDDYALSIRAGRKQIGMIDIDL